MGMQSLLDKEDKPVQLRELWTAVRLAHRGGLNPGVELLPAVKRL